MLSAPPKIQMLIELTRNNLIVRGCIGRVLSAIVPQRVHIRERTGPGAQFKALKPELEKFLESYLSKFLTSALESTLVCGFVVFVIRRHILHGKEVEVPVVLPLGAFTWEVKPTSKDTNKRFVKPDALYYYEITPLHHDLKIHDLHIYHYNDPVPSNQIFPSNVDGILLEFTELQNFEMMIRRIDEWNSIKHITTSETVNAPLDQTTDGISLLDDFRRYIMSGEHSGISSNYMVMCGSDASAAREDPSNIANSWIEKFSFAGAKGDSTCVHLMPPNTTVNELGALELKHDRHEFYKRFEKHVMAFFEMTPFDDVSGQDTATIAYEVQVQGMRRLSAICTLMLEHVYACTFQIEETDVKILLPRPALPESMLAKNAPPAKAPVKAKRKSTAPKPSS